MYYTRLAQQVSPACSVISGSESPPDSHSTPSVSKRYPERAKEVSPAGSVTSGSESPPDSHSIPSVSLRYFEKAEATAKAKYERLVKFVDFYS